MFTEGTGVEVSFQEEKHDAWLWHVGTVMEVKGINKFLVKFQCPGDADEEREFALSDVRPPPPCVEDNVFVEGKEVEAYSECCWWSGVIKELLEDGKCRVVLKPFEKEMEFDHVNLRPRMVWTDGKWSNEAKSIKELTDGNNSAKRKRGRPKKLPKKQIGNEAKSSAENEFQMSATLKEILNNVHSRRLGSGAGRHNGVLRKRANTPLLEGQTGEAVISERVKRPNNSVSNGHGGLSKPVNSESQDQDCHEIYHAEYGAMMIDEVADATDGQLPSTGLNILHPIGSDDSRALPVSRQDGFGAPLDQEEDTMESSPIRKTDCPNDLAAKNFNQCEESNGKGGELGPPATARTDTMENEESLPFVKRSALWKHIESWETYKSMTKQPHFAPLCEQKEEDREGLAIAHLVNFFNLVADTSKLQFSSEIAVMQKSLEALVEYKSHGFDVEKVEARLTQLLLKKQRAMEFEKASEDIKSKISATVDEAELNEKLSRLRQEFREIEKEIGEAELQKENRKKAMSTLRSQQHTIEENVKTLQVEFETIVASLGSLYGN